MSQRAKAEELIAKAMDSFQIELPSWGFANTGTRFGKFLQPAAAATIEEKFSDAGVVHAFTGICPSVALHVRWDLPNGLEDADKVLNLARHFGVRAGSINPNFFEDQSYRFGSFGNPNGAIRDQAVEHLLESIAIARRLESRDLVLWFADGSDYPGSADIRQRKCWFEEGLKRAHSALDADARL